MQRVPGCPGSQCPQVGACRWRLVVPCYPARELSSRCESRTLLVPRTQVFWAACPALEGLPGTGTECRGDTHGGSKARKRGWTMCWEERGRRERLARRWPLPSQEDKEFGLDPAGSPPLTDATLPSGVTSSGTVVRSHFPPSYRERYEHSAYRRGEGACVRLSGGHRMSLIIICAATASRKPPFLPESKARILGPLLCPFENVLCALRYLNSFLLQGPLNCLSGNQERGFDIETFLTNTGHPVTAYS